jgi:hypothetical protein
MLVRMELVLERRTEVLVVALVLVTVLMLVMVLAMVPLLLFALVLPVFPLVLLLLLVVSVSPVVSATSSPVRPPHPASAHGVTARTSTTCRRRMRVKR